jgi:DNA polymerase-3 subunit alpha
LIVNEVTPLDELNSRFTTGLTICLDQAQGDADTLKALHEIVRGYPGQLELHFRLTLADSSHVYLKSNRARLDITPELVRRVDDLLGPGRIQRITAQPPPSAPKSRNGARRR